MNVIGAKVVASCLLFCVALVFGSMPYFGFRRYLKKLPAARGDSRRPFIIQYLHSLASGVLIATSLLHLLPESLGAVREALDDSKQSRQPAKGSNVTNITGHTPSDNVNCQHPARIDHFPVAECLVALGFLFVYMIDSSIKACRTSHDRASYMDTDPDNHDLSEGVSSRDPSRYSSAQKPNCNSTHKQLTLTDRRCNKQFAQQGKPLSYFRWLRTKLSTQAYKQNQNTIVDEHCHFIARDADSLSNFEDDLHEVDLNSEKCESVRSTSSVEAHPLAALTSPQPPFKSTQLRSVALVAALCIHGFFDGVMLGLQTSLSAAMSLMLGLSIHKTFVSVGLSLSLLASRDGQVPASITLFYILSFASTAPLGVLVSAAFLHNSFDASGDKEISLVPGCMQAFAVGTFLYVAFTETTELHHRMNLSTTLVKHIILLAGFSLMAALRTLLGGL